MNASGNHVLPWPAALTPGNRPVVSSKNGRIVVHPPQRNRDGRRQLVGSPVTAQRPFGNLQKISSFSRIQIVAGLKTDEVFSTQGLLFGREQLQGFSSIIQTVLPADARTIIDHLHLSKSGGLVRKHAEVPRTMHESGEINAGFLTIIPHDIKHKRLLSGRNRLHSNRRPHDTYPSLKLLPLGKQRFTVSFNPSQRDAAKPGWNGAAKNNTVRNRHESLEIGRNHMNMRRIVILEVHHNPKSTKVLQWRHAGFSFDDEIYGIICRKSRQIRHNLPQYFNRHGEAA